MEAAIRTAPDSDLSWRLELKGNSRLRKAFITEKKKARSGERALRMVHPNGVEPFGDYCNY